MCGNKNKSLSTKSGLYGGWAINSKFCTVEKALIWADVWELTLAWWTIIRLLLFVFQISPKKLWCTTQDWPSYVAEVEQSPHDQFYRRNRRPFSSKRFFHKQLSLEWLDFENLHGGLLFCFGLIRIGPWFVTCDDLINVFWSIAIAFVQHLFAPIDTSLFLSDCQIVRELVVFTIQQYNIWRISSKA